jgi:hypothetical protein
MVILTIKWIARILGSLLFLFWGSFFIAHIMPWFILPLFRHEKIPSFEIWIQEFFHLCMLLGFIIAFKYELIGGLIIIFGAAVYFFLARTNASICYFGITIIPALLYIFSWWKS